MNKWTRKLADDSGSSFVLVLVMVTVVLVICSAVLGLFIMQYRLVSRDYHRLQARYTAEAGVHKVLWLMSGHEGKDPGWRPEAAAVSLWEGASAVVSAEPWGGFIRITSGAHDGNISETVIAVAGEEAASCFDKAVMLGEEGFPLVVTGRNRITGDVLTGMRGVRSGKLAGREFEGDELVDGNIERDQSPALPAFDSDRMLRSMDDWQAIIDRAPANVTTENGRWTIRDTLKQSPGKDLLFFRGDIAFENVTEIHVPEAPIIIGCTGCIHFSGSGNIEGPVLFLAGDSIVVEDANWLRHVIFYSPGKVRFGGDARMEGQIFSEKEIIIQDRAVLLYPSVILCRGYEDELFVHGDIRVTDQAVVQGTVILAHDAGLPGRKRNEMAVHIGKAARLTGAVYSENHTELSGTVTGSVVTRDFYLFRPPTTYLNWLCDAVIDRTALPEGFCTPLGFDRRPSLHVVHWEN